MGLRRTSLVLLVFSIFPALARAGEEPANLQARALESYDRALANYGVALGEREDPDDPACKLIERSVADLLCLKGDVDGCLQASKSSKRKLGPYVPPVEVGRRAGIDKSRQTRAFLLELHEASAGWGKDRSLLSELLGLVDRVEGDTWLFRARSAAGPGYRNIMQKVREGHPARHLKALVEAGRLAFWMLDGEKMFKVAGLAADGVVAAAGKGNDLSTLAEELRPILVRGRDQGRILGLEVNAGLEKALQILETKALTPPDLAFEMGPDTTGFESDSGKARVFLASLAKRAPLHTRASVLLSFAAAYLGVLEGDAQAVDHLSRLGDDLFASDPYLAARVRGLLGRSALLVGDYYRAGRLLDQAATQLRTQPQTASLRGLMLANGARATFYLGAYEKAAELFSQAAKLFDKRPDMALDAMLGAVHALSFS